ncbi:STAS domain-containing protein [Bacillus sp. FJAT-45350]|uniref:STAS domain-containing protein n=1 Tax=Bacillus sp. FJAT-45350 TaxID=2011014 RepID=UPI000BB8160E|nr:STAS domain-containing protein [Bacillus sp. FJAT-45350]
MLPEINVVNGVVQVRLSGKVYVEGATILREKLAPYLEKGHKDFIVDLGPVTYIDSSGLGVLIGIQKKAVQNGGDITIKNLKGDVKELFELTRLTKVFTIE